MGNTSSIREQITQVRTELSACRERLGGFDAQEASLRRRSVGLFDQLMQDMEMVRGVMAEQQILAPFFAAFGNVLSMERGYLAIYGQVVIPMDFDAESCISVYVQQKDRFFDLCMGLINDDEKWAELINAADSISVLREISGAFNTIQAIYWSHPQLREWAEEAISREIEEQRRQTAQQEADLLARLEQLELQWQQEQQRMAEKLAAFKQTISETDFSCSIPQQERFIENPQIPLGYDSETGTSLCWSLGKYNGVRLVVPPSRIKDLSVQRAALNTVYHFLRGYPSGATRLAIYDTCMMPEWKRFRFALSTPTEYVREKGENISVEDAIFYTSSAGHKSRSEIAAAFEVLYEVLRSENNQNPLAFNVTHEDSFRPITLFVIYGCASDFVISKELADALEITRLYGIYLLIVEEERAVSQNGWRSYHAEERTVSQLKNLLTLRLTSQEMDDLQVECEQGRYQLAQPAADFDPDAFRDDFQRLVLQQYRRPLLLKKLLSEYKRGGTDFSKVLNIPVGREENGEFMTLSFQSGSSNAHLAMIGKTGSGKSSILQAIVLGGAYLYSPDELEFYLIDLKQGDAFYKPDVVDYSKLRHVRMLAATCTPKDIQQFIQYIVDTKMKGKDDPSGPKTDIIAYNKTHDIKLRRTVIVIDEYTQITDDVTKNNLKLIAAQGRSYGISLVLSSQMPGDSGIMSQVGNMIEFKNDQVGALVDRGALHVSVADRMFLIGRVGNCIASMTESKQISHLRAAYMDMKSLEQASFIEEINAKYATYKTEPSIVIGREQPRQTCDRAAELTCASTSDGMLSATVGKNLFGQPQTLEFGKEAHQLGKLLLIGDVQRAKHLEYSLLSAAKDAQKFYLSFGEPTDGIFRRMSDMRACDTEEKIGEALQEVYDLYMNRKEGAQISPVMLVLHNCGHCDQFFLKEKPTEPMVEKKDPLAMLQARQAEQSSQKDPDFAAMLAMYGKVKQYQPKHHAPPAGGMCAILRTLLDEGVAYGICTVLSCDFGGIRNAKDILDSQLYNCFGGSIAIPSLKGDDMIAKGNLLVALKNVGADNLRTTLEKIAFSRNQRVRCYRIMGNDYSEFMPYEWEEQNR